VTAGLLAFFTFFRILGKLPELVVAVPWITYAGFFGAPTAGGLLAVVSWFWRVRRYIAGPQVTFKPWPYVIAQILLTVLNGALLAIGGVMLYLGAEGWPLVFAFGALAFFGVFLWPLSLALIVIARTESPLP
jgi:hypothetical protein